MADHRIKFLLDNLYMNMGKAVAEHAAAGLSTSDSTFLQQAFKRALLETVSENEEHIEDYEILDLAATPLNLTRIKQDAADHHLDFARYLDEGQRKKRHELLSKIDDEWKHASEKFSAMAAHFEKALEKCGHRLSSGVLGEFKKLHGKSVSKKELAYLATMGSTTAERK